MATQAAESGRARGLGAAVSALRHRNFRLFWTGQMISLAGSSMQSIGQAWLVLELTHSAWQLGLVGALQSLPLLLFSLAGGVLADRWPKRTVLLCTRTAAMVQAILLWTLISTGAVQLWQVYVLALLLGLADCLGRPAGQSFVVELVGRADLPNAVALNSASNTLTRVAGPALAGLIIAAGGVAPLYALNALSFIAALGSLALLDVRTLHAQARRDADDDGTPTLWQSLSEGLHYVWATPPVLLVIVVAGLVLLCGSNFNVVLPVYATDVLHAGPRGFGFLSAASGAGALLASLWLAWRQPQATIRRVLAGTLAFAALEALFAVCHVYVLSLALLAGVGGAEIAFAMLAITMLQTVAPDHLRGRVMSVCIVFFDGSLPLGYVLMGWLVSQYGAPRALLSGALLSLLVAGAGWLWRPRAERALAQPASLEA